ncbi:hypothetical protein OIY81_1379 [Cryptosporidium canis]|uniref:Uncharacterized protein n=1 Tax=Cryptosporidium canis TaxID=195482 RepID=A0ABQ8P5X2_9CRYT|nr:hypothetical protein OJ252_2203 [Cryptosporidium canis]KAJ1612167.1 hypothetical protein OIY81_1379 [Cryptosporidium canis]
MIYPIGNLDTYLQALILKNDIQTIRLSLLGICEDTLYTKISENSYLKDKSTGLNSQINNISLLDFFREIVSSSYKGDLRFLLNNSFKGLCEEELHDSLPFLTARYLPLIIDYFQNNKYECKIEGVDFGTLETLCSLAKSISDRMAFKLLEDPMSGMSSEFYNNEELKLFFKLFFNNKITLKINPSKEWRSNEFFKLPSAFKSRASKIAARKRLMRLLPINMLSNKYMNSMYPSTCLPWSPNIIDKTIRRYNFRCSLIGALNNILSNFGRIVSKQSK